MSKEQRRMDRFIVIPFSSTCRSGSSVDVVDARHGKKPQGGGEVAAMVGCAGKPKGESLSLLARLLKGFKNLSQIFAVYEDDEEEEEQEMVIGLPTDVKHVAHIGWDGSTSTASSVRSWNRAAPPPPPAAASTSSPAAPLPQANAQPPLPPALSVRQFELAMAAQAAAGTGTATAASTSTSTTAAARQYCHS